MDQVPKRNVEEKLPDVAKTQHLEDELHFDCGNPENQLVKCAFTEVSYPVRQVVTNIEACLLIPHTRPKKSYG